MSLFGRLWERRDTSFQTVWGADLDADSSPWNGAAVTHGKALGLSAVFACVRLLADTVGTLPLRLYARDGDRRIELDAPDWVARPVPRDPSITRAVHFGQVITSLLLDGNAFVLVSPDVSRPSELRVLDPRQVTIERAPDSAPRYIIRGDRSGAVDWTRMVHVSLIRLAGEPRGLSPLEAERLTFQGAIAAEDLAGRFLRNGTWLSALVRYPAGARVTDEDAARVVAGIEAKWGGSRRAGRVGVLTGGAELQQLSVTPEQAQFLETRQYDDERIFRVFRCPPALVGMTREGAVSFASSVMQSEAFEKHTIRPLLDQVESAYRLLVPPGEYLRFNTAALLRADLATRTAAHNAALDHKWRTVDEVRAIEDLDPFGGDAGGLLQTPNNNAPGGATT